MFTGAPLNQIGVVLLRKVSLSGSYHAGKGLRKGCSRKIGLIKKKKKKIEGGKEAVDCCCMACLGLSLVGWSGCCWFYHVCVSQGQ